MKLEEKMQQTEQQLQKLKNTLVTMQQNDLIFQFETVRVYTVYIQYERVFVQASVCVAYFFFERIRARALTRARTHVHTYTFTKGKGKDAKPVCYYGASSPRREVSLE